MMLLKVSPYLRENMRTWGTEQWIHARPAKLKLEKKTERGTLESLPDHHPHFVMTGAAALAAQFGILGGRMRLHFPELHLRTAHAGRHLGRTGRKHSLHGGHIRVSLCSDEAP